MTLVVDSIKCVEESDEAGSDDVYLIVFRGRTTPPFESNVQSIGPGSVWSNYDTGESEGTDVNLAFTQQDAVYAIQLVEEDSSKDISGDEVLGAYKTQVGLAWRGAMLSHSPNTGTDAAKADGYEAVRQALLALGSVYMEFPFGDDDQLGIKRVRITKSGQAETIRFRSNAEDATYDIRFKHT
jgi:hypothetical protein